MITSQFRVLAMAVTSFAMLTPAYAALGGAPTYPVTAGSTSAGAASQATAVARFAASANTAPSNYTVSQTTLPSGTVVSEYISAGNTVFGIDTQANNALTGTGAPIIQTNLNGDFTSTYNGTTLTQTFFDSGSTVLFFPDLTIAHDSTSGYYIPTTTVGRTSTLVATNPASVSLGFNIGNGATLGTSGNSAFNNLGVYMTRQFDFGMPFFYGRHVYYGITGRASADGGTGPYVAYVSS